ncbi:RraA family protein [Mangrovicoccus algicola]|uniref:Putative 4-hydroxy-4-methyl-2-oxoglutarate aldolase n=1 Tax=Mangrovicoccus algicola TaxID=2771008 RepID=A0A8J6YVK6_9RHOB|nr:RraA family protein [Mangrovicoccus algicola]MBE3638437.1 RraA family protein [Mangrovicoccus algicola]
MLETPPLLTIRRPARRPTEAQIAAFRGLPASYVADAMGGGGALDTAIAPPLPEAVRAVGPALTAENRAGDLLATAAALRVLQPGDILMAGVGGFGGCAAAGDLVIGMARNAGAAGFVTDGPLRDCEALIRVGLPVWCSGLNPASPTAKGPGRVGEALMIGGRQVETGDMVVADRDGVVVVPFARIDAVIAALETVKALEAETEAAVAAGATSLAAIDHVIDSDQTVWL